MEISQPLNSSVKKEVGLWTQAYQDQLQQSQEAMDYLTERGFSAGTIEAAKLGYVGSAVELDHKQYEGRIVIPYLTTTGPVAIRFRTLPGDESGAPKYKDMSGVLGKPRLYNVQALAADPGGSMLYFCEGEFDTLTASQMGLTAVGCSGVNKWQDHWRMLLEGYDRIRILADNDDKGQGYEMGKTIESKMPKHDIRTILMPEGFDVNSAYLDGGKEDLLAWISGDYEE
jgi:DNA primase